MPRTGKTAQAGEIQMAREAELMDLAATQERSRLWAELKRHWKGEMGPAYVYIKEIEHLFKPTPE